MEAVACARIEEVVAVTEKEMITFRNDKASMEATVCKVIYDYCRHYHHLS